MLNLESISELSFGRLGLHCALSIYLASSIIWSSTISAFLPSGFTLYANILCGFLLLLAELSGYRYGQRYGIGEFLAIVLICICAIAGVHAKAGGIVLLALFVFVARNHSFCGIAKVAIVTMIVVCTIVAICGLSGVSLNYIWVQGQRVRSGLGFRYTTYMSHYILFATMLLCYMRKGRIGITLSLIILVINLLVFFTTDSRNSFLMTIGVVLVAPFIARGREVSNKVGIISKCCVALLPVLAIISVALMVFYDSSSYWMYMLNDLLGGRLAISHRTYSLYGVSLFGSDAVWYGNSLSTKLTLTRGLNEVTFVDNSFCNVLLRYGILVLGCALILFARVVFKLVMERERLLVFLFVVLTIHSTIDPWWLALQYDVFLLLIGSVLLGHRELYSLTE